MIPYRGLSRCVFDKDWFPAGKQGDPMASTQLLSAILLYHLGFSSGGQALKPAHKMAELPFLFHQCAAASDSHVMRHGPKPSEITNYFMFKKVEGEKPRKRASKDHGNYLRLPCWAPCHKTLSLSFTGGCWLNAALCFSKPMGQGLGQSIQKPDTLTYMCLLSFTMKSLVSMSNSDEQKSYARITIASSGATISKKGAIWSQ